ncbi:peptide-methionine (S)-S-oxide reductase MsrA [Candidatus Saccharibacteria bacterium]|nr:peptide-methionine (S)-S-oxide reductase MsrA [Candidatus Saccharibacteria bacterium]
MNKIVLGGGCFWCIEAVYQQVKGVEKVVSGFAGGDPDDEPDYWKIHDADNKHAEVIQVTYDETVISLQEILEIFFGTHDPTTTQQPGTADAGSEYRSIILCAEDEVELAEKAKQDAQKNWNDQIITEIKLLDTFTPADASHQNYYNRNTSAGYCQVVINPKLDKFRKNFTKYLK